jgi:hypothetical protein
MSALGIDATQPSAARIYDYLLGGTHNYEADREAIEKLLAIAPEIRDLAQANRAFLINTVQWLTELGIDQFLDLGSGLPTARNVHEVAQAINPAARTVYVDIDPSILPQAHALLFDDDQTAYVEADIRVPNMILEHPETTRLIDFSRPLALLLVTTMHFVPDADDPYGILDRFLQACPPGSYLVASHILPDDMHPDLAKVFIPLNETLPQPVTWRSYAQVSTFFRGLDLIGPGVVDLPQWSPTGRVEGKIGRLRSVGGVALKQR